MTGSKLIGLVVAIVAIAYFAFPGFKAKVDDVYDKHAGWNEEARRKDPVGFMDYSIKRLGENIDKFESAKASLGSAKAKLDELQRTNQEKLAFAEKQLNEFKMAYKAAKADNKWPLEVAGKKYSEAELKSQVDLLLSQKGGYDGILKQVSTGLGSAEKKQFELVNRISESKSKLGLLQTQKELVKVNALTKDTEKMLADVNEVLVQNEAMAQGSAVRTVEELMQESKAATDAAHPSADAFLNS